MAVQNKGFAKFVDCYGPDSVFAIATINLASGTPTLIEGQGVVSVTKGTTGVYNLVLVRGWKNACVTATLQLGAVSNSIVLTTGITPGTRTVQLTTATAGAAADLTGTIHVQILLRKSV